MKQKTYEYKILSGPFSILQFSDVFGEDRVYAMTLTRYRNPTIRKTYIYLNWYKKIQVDFLFSNEIVWCTSPEGK